MYQTPLAQRAADILHAPFANPGEMGRQSYAEDLIHRLLWMIFTRFLEVLDALALRWMNGTLPEPKPQAPRPPRQARRETAARQRQGTARQPASPLCAQILAESPRTLQTWPTPVSHQPPPKHPLPAPEETRRRTRKPRLFVAKTHV